MYTIINAAASRSARGAGGAMRLLVFFVLLMLLCWAVNMYRHYQHGWTKGQKIMDFIGAALLLICFVLTAAPLLKL